MLNLGKIAEARWCRSVFTALATIVATLAISSVAQAETVTRRRVKDPSVTPGSFHGAYLAATILAALGTVLAWTLINTRLASSTMTGGTPRGLSRTSTRRADLT